MHLRHHCDLAGVELDEVPDRVNADELGEAPHEVLIELHARRFCFSTSRMRSVGNACWYVRCDRIASYTSAMEQSMVPRLSVVPLDAEGIARCRPGACGARRPSTGASVGMSGVARRISAPSTTWRRMISNSCVVQLVGLVEDLERRSAPCRCRASAPRGRTRAAARPSMPTARACPIVRIETFTMCVNV